ncbi:uncharacterized protein LOC113162253 isoform X2 [Anabas testudineus]|uniref:uncharacterized protein LOC113162253 isoform X2 n=1 Tax=Anabas testudineus TaxID=64144 RepID=UPI000E456217|nr:uncharacterized protein LOC113162253 isoform X2 [Anabas testudineus]
MIRIYVWAVCLFSALTVEMKILSVTGHVGENVTFKCSGWGSWTGVESNVKYFCESPCTQNKHVIIKVESGQNKLEDRISLNNTGDVLSVTIMELQKSDSKTYYCGVEKRFSRDLYIEVDLKVEEVVSAVTVTATESTTSLSSPDMSTSFITLHTTETTESETQGLGTPLFLIIVLTVIVTILVVLAWLIRKMRKENQLLMRTDSQEKHAQQDIEYDQINLQDDQIESLAVADCLYANYSSHKGTVHGECSTSEVVQKGVCTDRRVKNAQSDLVYSFAQLHKEQTEAGGQCESNAPVSLYCLVQQPQAT